MDKVNIDSMSHCCRFKMYFCLCFVLQPVSKLAGVSRGLVGLVGWGRIGYIQIWSRRGGGSGDKISYRIFSLYQKNTKIIHLIMMIWLVSFNISNYKLASGPPKDPGGSKRILSKSKDIDS